MANLGTTGDDAVPPDKICDEKILTEKSLNEMSPAVIGTRKQKSTEELTYVNPEKEVEVAPVLSTMDTPKRSGLESRTPPTQDNLNDVVMKRRLPTVTPVPPNSPRNNTEESPGVLKDYRKLYHDTRVKLLKQTETNALTISKASAEIKELKEKLEATSRLNESLVCNEQGSNASNNMYEIGILKTKLTELKEKSNFDYECLKRKYEEEISDKDKSIATLRKEKIDLEGLTKGLKWQNKELIGERDELRSKLETPNHRTLCRVDGEEVIKTKSKAKNKKAIEKLKCEYLDCDKKDEESLIKCNACGNWICEACSEIAIAKIKPLINKCRTLFFTCADCYSSCKDAGFTVPIKSPPPKNIDIDKTPVEDNGTLLTMLTGLLDQKVEQIERNMIKIMDEKIANGYAKNTQTINAQGDAESKLSYAKVLQVPAEVRKIMQEAKNDEKIEQNEIERRQPNFIIHGAEEFGRNEEKIKDNDNEYISDILTKLGVTAKPLNVVRLGQRNESEMRPIKVVMKSKTDKQMVMANLRRLKGTTEEFGKISITEDYTVSQREQIKKFALLAKEKNNESGDFVYKVRGDPKNGLRLVPFPK